MHEMYQYQLYKMRTSTYSCTSGPPEILWEILKEQVMNMDINIKSDDNLPDSTGQAKSGTLSPEFIHLQSPSCPMSDPPIQ